MGTAAVPPVGTGSALAEESVHWQGCLASTAGEREMTGRGNLADIADWQSWDSM